MYIFREVGHEELKKIGHHQTLQEVQSGYSRGPQIQKFEKPCRRSIAMIVKVHLAALDLPVQRLQSQVPICGSIVNLVPVLPHKTTTILGHTVYFISQQSFFY